MNYEKINNYVCKPLLSTALAVCLCSSVWANDTSIGDDNGTIVFKQQAEISMDKEILQISENLVEVDYVFTNTGEKDLTVLIAFPMPPRMYDPGDRNQISDFKLWVDGVVGKTKRKMVVLLDGKTDITAAVTKLGWNAQELNELLIGADAPKGKKRLPTEWFFDGNSQPLFTLNEYFIWQQTFPAGQPVSIRHSYSPSVTTGVPMPADHLITNYGEQTCMDDSAKAGVRTRGLKPGGVSWRYLSYILLTANNWNGPIKDFTLRIEKQLPTDLVSTCFEGALKKTGPLTFEYQQKNFRPKNNLSILFIPK